MAIKTITWAEFKNWDFEGDAFDLLMENDAVDAESVGADWDRRRAIEERNGGVTYEDEAGMRAEYIKRVLAAVEVAKKAMSGECGSCRID